jgi:hypothetical protein
VKLEFYLELKQQGEVRRRTNERSFKDGRHGNTKGYKWSDAVQEDLLFHLAIAKSKW